MQVGAGCRMGKKNGNSNKGGGLGVVWMGNKGQKGI